MSYDTDNVFAKILRGEIPAERIHENAFAIAFPDKFPDAPVHVLVIPKKGYERYDDFMARASEAEIVGFFRAVRETAKKLNLTDYRLATNNGEGAGQVIHHFHVHILSGKKLAKLG